MTALTVIDDDPTGAQCEAGVPLLLEWPDELLERVAERPAAAVHLLTNSRALGEEDAYGVVRAAVEAAVERLPGRRVVLRGDSTLRAHVLPEYAAVRDGALGGRDVPHVLVPALPAAGRVTVDGVHWLEREGRRLPLDETEYAADAAFGYSTARLLAWAEERSGGYFGARDGRELHLDELRAPDGAERLARVLGELAAAGRPAVLAPDAESADDLRTIADGLDAVAADGIEAIVRCAPAFVGVAAGTTAQTPVALPRAERGVLVVVGSHVPATTRQLARLLGDGTAIEIDPRLVLAAGGADHVHAVAARARAELAANGLAVVATQRTTERELLTQASGMRIAEALAAVVAATRAEADVIVAKGGITSAVVARRGLGAREALVVGPVVDGVSLWEVPAARLLVVPGNVGADDLLASLVERIRPA
jgi:uncharacterized protein YgbK (DUF1537 family)